VASAYYRALLTELLSLKPDACCGHRPLRARLVSDWKLLGGTGGVPGPDADDRGFVREVPAGGWGRGGGQRLSGDPDGRFAACIEAVGWALAVGYCYYVSMA
jgi:hypothetical protein